MDYPPLKSLNLNELFQELENFLTQEEKIPKDNITEKLLLWNYVNQYGDFYTINSESYFSDFLILFKDYLNWELISKEVNKTISIEFVNSRKKLPWKFELFGERNL